ncbi:MAG: hypothetical protein JWN37_308 [Candidatus Nomurabacteria bacterium]|nr:hypothetical protein [Candidatus Nomurabacteria bacterium]
MGADFQLPGKQGMAGRHVHPHVAHGRNEVCLRALFRWTAERDGQAGKLPRCTVWCAEFFPAHLYSKVRHSSPGIRRVFTPRSNGQRAEEGG